jgi:nicotinamide mononucleotide transporter
VTEVCAWLTSHGTSCLEVVAVAFGIVSVFLSVRENIWSWPTALVNVALYTVLFYATGLYSDMGLQVVYFVLSIYGWYEWLYGGKNRTELQVSRTPRSMWVALGVIGVVFWAVDGYATSHLPNVSLPYVDAGTTTVSLIAQYMMTRKYLENWTLWIAVDVVYVGMLIYKGLNLTAFNYAIYLVLAVMGHVAWRKSLGRAAEVVVA